MAESRSSLWTDVVLNLAILTVVTIGLNAVLLWRLGQGRENAKQFLRDNPDLIVEMRKRVLEKHLGTAATPASE